MANQRHLTSAGPASCRNNDLSAENIGKSNLEIIIDHQQMT
jgi:hypothetical protein